MSLQGVDLSALSRADERSGAPAIPPPRRRWKTRYLAPGLLLVAVAGILGYSARESLTPVVEVQVAPVVQRSTEGARSVASAVVQAPGWVEADPFPQNVTALASGIVEEVLALEGEAVKAGQLVARLVSEDARLALQGAEAELALRRAELAAAEARLTAARRDWEHPIELTRKVEVARASQAERQAELARWPAELAAEEAQAEQLRFEHLRVKALHEQGQTSDLEHVRAEQQYIAQRAKADATRGREAVLHAEIEALQAEVTAAERNLALRIPDTLAVEQAAAALQEAQAALQAAVAARDEAALRLARMEIRAPSDGMVQARLVAPGSKLMLDADDPTSAVVLRLYDPSRLQVRVDVPLAEAAKVGVGQEAEIVVHVLPERSFRGRVTRITNEADVQKNTLQIKVAIESPAPEIKPEMLTRVKFLAQQAESDAPAEERLFAPKAAISSQGEDAAVWVADAQGRAERRRITVGEAQLGGWIEVNSGLRAGDRVVMDAPPTLREGRRLRVVGEWAGEVAHGAD